MRRSSLVVLSLLLAACGAAETPVADGGVDVGPRETAGAQATTTGTAEARHPQVAPATPGPPMWETDLDFALKRAEAEHRPMLIDFSAGWCAACQRLKKQTFVDPLFLAEAGRFVLVNVDVTNDEDPKVVGVLKKWGVQGLPLLVLRDSSGKEIARLDDFVAADALAPKLAAVP